MFKNRYESEKYILEIEQDDNAINPREWWQLGRIVIFSNKYKYLADNNDFEDVEEFKDFAKNNEVVYLPIYLLDHGVISISCSSFSCTWDSGQIGYIYTTKEDIMIVYGAYNEDARKIANKNLINEIEEYNMYLTGDMYRYTLTEKKHYKKIYINDTNRDEEFGYDEEIIDCCGNFFGTDIENNGLLDEIPNHIIEELYIKQYN